MERRRREDRETRQRTILQQRIHEVKQEMEDMQRDVNSCLTEMEACFNLLLPRFDQPDIYKSRDIARDDLHGGRCAVGVGVPRDAAGDGDCPPPKKQRRTTTSSSCSFVSLSEDGDSDGEVDDDKDEVEVERGEDREENKMEKGGGKKNIEGEEEEKTNKESQGGIAATASCRVVLEDASSNDLLKGSSQLADESAETSSGSDSDADVEWEDVAAPVTSSSEVGDVGAVSVVMQEHGLASRGLVVPVRLGPRVEVRETEDNTSILSSLRENRQLLLAHFLPTLNRCLEVLGVTLL